MPVSRSGKVAAVMLFILITQFLTLALLTFENPFGAIVYFIVITPFTGLLGLIFGILGVIKEKGTGRILPVLTLIVSLIFIALELSFLFGYSFEG
ncbi:hypothetical protein [Jeotgalibacillus sp. R-1-5s-1]|uniref:hypothetical protein n=1 Tax=Jeotgalibacillus sp. R-1-5s-1 TaxID=2555897 RepID=UPI00106D0731|nr:hypothetical protein [Jeotgalibacillus sp. R-1-5s-1]TFD94495.1 hypothetical protein E2491_13765 [Jeotgalibacillus sp. R-1-5s-1]